MATITIPPRFCGPTDSGNGGFTCGLLAEHVAPPQEITLRAPPPLDTPLEVVTGDDGVTRAFDGDELVAEGATVDAWSHEIPNAPTWEQAERAAARYAGLQRHAFPLCFVCGHVREPGDGLRILAGPVPGRDIVASPWLPSGGLPEEDGLLTTPMVWAALDCPGAWAVERAAQDRPVVLGRMAAVQMEPVAAEGRYLAVGWPVAIEGRKLLSGTALFDEHGVALATARQIWIVLA